MTKCSKSGKPSSEEGHVLYQTYDTGVGFDNGIVYRIVDNLCKACFEKHGGQPAQVVKCEQCGRWINTAAGEPTYTMSQTSKHSDEFQTVIKCACKFCILNRIENGRQAGWIISGSIPDRV
jgi:hypothetical protein